MAHALAAGLAVEEFEPESKAAAEIQGARPLHGEGLARRPNLAAVDLKEDTKPSAQTQDDGKGARRRSGCRRNTGTGPVSSRRCAGRRWSVWCRSGWMRCSEALRSGACRPRHVDDSASNSDAIVAGWQIRIRLSGNYGCSISGTDIATRTPEHHDEQTLPRGGGKFCSLQRPHKPTATVQPARPRISEITAPRGRLPALPVGRSHSASGSVSDLWMPSSRTWRAAPPQPATTWVCHPCQCAGTAGNRLYPLGWDTSRVEGSDRRHPRCASRQLSVQPEPPMNGAHPPHGDGSEPCMT